MKTVEGLVQGTESWKAARSGRVTASRISDVMATIKTGEATTRRDYKFQLVSEMLTGQPQDSIFVNDAMKWGTEQEPFARAAYECATSTMVDQVGLVYHPSIELGAASPDGLVGSTKLVEIKCPKTSTHIATVLSSSIPRDYQLQMLWQMACCGPEFTSCDFVSFRPDLPKHLQLHIINFPRDNDRIRDIEAEVNKFINEVQTLVNQLMEIKK